MHPIEQKITLFLEQVCDGKAAFSEELIQEFGERCKSILRDGFVEKPMQDKKFTLRMSNMGHSVRKLMLDRASGGKYKPSKEFKLKATIGHIYEAFVLVLLKQSGVNVIDHDKKVALAVGEVVINGTYDVKIDGKIYDIKTASPFSYDNKFCSIENLRKDDAFGYFAQGFGYSLADSSPFGGWIPINKNTGEIKILEIPVYEHDKLASEYGKEIQDKVKYITSSTDIPPCTGVVDEYFNKKSTGNKILNRRCEYCDYKSTCHKDLQCLPDVNSKAREPRLRYYLGKVIKPKEKEA